MSKNLCADCKYRFTRVFIPVRPEEFVDENGNQMLEGFNGETNITGLNICLLTEVDINGDITVECSHHLPLKSKEEIGLFRHLKD